MSSNNPHLNQARLPQRGFAGDVDFESLCESNKFLYRVYTPKETSPFADDTDPFLVAPRFDELFNRSPVDVLTITDATTQWTYPEVAKHMDWSTRSSSVYITTSFSFTWAIWEAVRRYHLGVKKDVQIAILDAEKLTGRAATAVQLLNSSPPTAQNDQFWKWHRFSEDSQSVLVYGMIPRTAVLGSIPLLQILRKMPSYFLRTDVQIIEGNPLSQVAWDYMSKKHTYRQFCQTMRKTFASRPMESRLRDSTAGAVRLALSFLRPLFHNLVLEDFDRALSYLRALAITVSEWPASEWIQNHSEIRQIVEAMVLALGEELREKYSQQRSEEISRLHVVIDGLEDTLRAQTRRDRRAATRTRFVVDDIDIDSDGAFELELLEESEDPTLVSITAPHHDDKCEDRTGKSESDRPSLAVSVSVIPHIPIAFQTPITPPDSPSVPTACSKAAETTTAQVSFEPPSNSGADIPLHPYQVFSPSTARSPGEFVPISALPTPPLSQVFIFPSESTLGNDEDKSTQESSRAPDVHPLNVSDVEEKPVLPTAVQQETCCDMAAKKSKPEDNEFSSEGGTLMSTSESVPCTHDEEAHDGQDDDDKTRAGDSDQEELGDLHAYHPPSPSISHSWIAVRHRRLSSADRPVLSPRSSITSIATLWEPTEVPLKRMSLLSDSESHEYVPTMRSLGLMSRTVSFSFSDFSPPRSQPLALIEDVDPTQVPLPPSPSPSASEIPLPPPVSLSSSLSSHISSLTSTSSDTSSSTADSGSNTWLPLITPLPPSPAISTGSLLSSISRSSSSSSTSILSEWQRAHARSISPEPTPIDKADHRRQPYSIIPPKHTIRLLSPLPTSQPPRPSTDDDAEVLTFTPTRTRVRQFRKPTRSSHVGETASYIVTGFLVGAFVTLFLFSTQRRTIINLT